MMRLALCLAVALLPLAAATAEELARVDFETWQGPLPRIYGDEPQVLVNAPEPNVGRVDPNAPDARTGLRLKLQYGAETKARLTYYTVNFPTPVPIISEMQEASLWVKTNVPVSLKVAISPFGFIYHGPTVARAADWQQVTVKNLYTEMKNWCRRGERDADEGFISGLIVAVNTSPSATADLLVDDVTITAAEGARKRLAEEARKRRFARVRASVVSLPLSAEGRSLPFVLDRLDEAAAAGSDIVCLPMECVQTEGEPIPGPISQALAAKAKEHHMYVIGNLREVEKGAVGAVTDRDPNGAQSRSVTAPTMTYVTSFLCNRAGEIVGKYRKSHKLPDETMALGDDLPVFPTDFGPIAMRTGSDRFFADIDHVYAAKGARMIFWSQEREPMEDEWLQDYPSQGRAQDYSVFIACSRYSRAETGWITNFMPTYRGCPIGRSYLINREGMPIAYTDRKGSVATAVIPKSELSGPGRGPISKTYPGFKLLVEPVAARFIAPQGATNGATTQWAKRKIRICAIENHVGIDDMIAKLDQCGQMGADIVCTYELVWISGGTKEHIEARTKQAQDNLRRLREKAAQYKMYVLVGGVVDRLERNEAILYGRDGQEVGRYFKCVQTHPEQVIGTGPSVIETDFGRLGVRICADNALVELDRCYGVLDVDIMFDLTQDWGPDAITRNLRNLSRCMDAGFFRVECTHRSSEPQHRSAIVEPTGIPVAQSEYLGNGIVTAVVDLDNDRPRRYAREWTERKPGGYLPEYQDTQMPKEYNDLRATVIRQRRPELYGALWVGEKEQ
ncbi:carbon-nitrogen hydrolase family protein [bacterium]|nr:carbon-nitrogen hydrolase family protein [bacterium]